MQFSTIALGLAGALAALFAILVPFQRTLYAGAFCLMLVLLQVGAIFFLLGARLLGWMQVILYAGAVMVLVVLAIMTLPQRLRSLWAGSHLPKPLVASAFALGFIELVAAARFGASTGPAGAPGRGLEREMAAWLFGGFAPLTEAVGVLLLVAALGLLLDPGRERA